MWNIIAWVIFHLFLRVWIRQWITTWNGLFVWFIVPLYLAVDRLFEPLQEGRINRENLPGSHKSRKASGLSVQSLSNYQLLCCLLWFVSCLWKHFLQVWVCYLLYLVCVYIRSLLHFFLSFFFTMWRLHVVNKCVFVFSWCFVALTFSGC